MLPQCYPNYKTVHRRFQTWCRSEVLRGILMDIANELRERGVLDEEECFIDAPAASTGYCLLGFIAWLQIHRCDAVGIRPHGSIGAKPPISRLGLPGNNLLRLHT